MKLLVLLAVLGLATVACSKKEEAAAPAEQVQEAAQPVAAEPAAPAAEQPATEQPAAEAAASPAAH